jgi:hypothetical protein
MTSYAYLMWYLITYASDIDLLISTIKPARTAKAIIEKKPYYESTFKQHAALYLRYALMFRYGMLNITIKKDAKEEEIKEEEKLKSDDKLWVRYRELDFQVFCFIAPHLPPRQMASIDDKAWPYFV